jgi:predicted metal-dependent peptidase
MGKMTKDEALRLALSTLDEVRQETFRLLRDGQKLYAEDKVWSTIITIKETLAQTEKEPQIAFNPEVVGYVAPQTWVGLTDEEIDAIYEQHHNQYEECESVNWGYERAIEAKLKEKNHG